MKQGKVTLINKAATKMERKFAQKQKQIVSSLHLINQNDKTTNVEFLTSP